MIGGYVCVLNPSGFTYGARNLKRALEDGQRYRQQKQKSPDYSVTLHDWTGSGGPGIFKGPVTTVRL